MLTTMLDQLGSRFPRRTLRYAPVSAGSSGNSRAYRLRRRRRRSANLQSSISTSSFGPAIFGTGQCHHNCRSGPTVGANGDGASVGLNQSPGDGQPQPGSFGFCGVKGFKHHSPGFRCQPGAVVAEEIVIAGRFPSRPSFNSTTISTGSSACSTRFREYCGRSAPVPAGRRRSAEKPCIRRFSGAQSTGAGDGQMIPRLVQELQDIVLGTFNDNRRA